MSQQASPTLVAHGVLGPAVAEISAQIHIAQRLFVDAKTQFMLVNGAGSAISSLQDASRVFTQFFLNTQTNASTAAANIQTFHAQAVKAVANIRSEQALKGLTFIETVGVCSTTAPQPNGDGWQVIAKKKTPVFVFTPIIVSLTATRATVNTLAASIDATRRAALNAAIKAVEDLQKEQAALKAQFSASMPGALKKLGMNSDSSSLDLYLTVAPASLLDSVISLFKTKGVELASGIASKGAGAQGAAVEAGTKMVEGVINSVGSTSDLIELRSKIQRKSRNKEDLAAAILALSRLKEDQATDDQGAYLQNALIYIAEIQAAIAALSPQLAKLGTVYTAMDQELNAAITLIKQFEQNGIHNYSAVKAQTRVGIVSSRLFLVNDGLSLMAVLRKPYITEFTFALSAAACTCRAVPSAADGSNSQMETAYERNKSESARENNKFGKAESVAERDKFSSIFGSAGAPNFACLKVRPKAM
ncbi:hypothetical protein B0H12DRAFT_1077726 [Mycena haematopus]|nr:hypothetical protein B0H12DRAFT_1077726 [Mycena haematopus]